MPALILSVMTAAFVLGGGVAQASPGNPEVSGTRQIVAVESPAPDAGNSPAPDSSSAPDTAAPTQGPANKPIDNNSDNSDGGSSQTPSSPTGQATGGGVPTSGNSSVSPSASP